MLQENSSYETVFLHCYCEENIGICKSTETNKIRPIISRCANFCTLKYLFFKYSFAFLGGVFF